MDDCQGSLNTDNYIGGGGGGGGTLGNAGGAGGVGKVLR